MQYEARLPISRSEAEELVARLHSEIERVNHENVYWRFERVMIFGSYLTDKPFLGDIDLMCEV